MKKIIILVSLCTSLLLSSCHSNDSELLYGKYPEPLLIAVGVNPNVNKDYKELTREDLKKVLNFHFIKMDDEGQPLEQYGFEDNKEYDFSIILEMPNMTHLDIDLGREIRLKDYSILKKLHNLESLRIGNITDKDIENIIGLNSLDSLSIVHSKITNIDFLKNLNQLDSFYLYDVPDVQNFNPLKYLKNVRAINIVNCDVSEVQLDTIPDMTTLQFMSLSVNNIKNIVKFPKMANLQYLSLVNNPLINFNIPSDTLPNLKSLTLDGTLITDADNINGVDSIEMIYLFRTGIKRVAPLKKFKNLKTVYCDENIIEDEEYMESLGINVDGE
ncbi:internalin-A precursor [Oxobacter pfennigii]|uniref:Internalin-A n=1 Tax=Oxobacter pfennigii TaxID=36849 RepID=A0A0P8YH14_9CLOT|nr:leucine-rich repeat domain-containing protein [Oxobacter pfennigii]KPU46388.1 internalin-A precursor [Oxobacter pfennigii]